MIMFRPSLLHHLVTPLLLPESRDGQTILKSHHENTSKQSKLIFSILIIEFYPRAESKTITFHYLCTRFNTIVKSYLNG